MKLLWVLAVFVLVVITVFIPGSRVFTDLVYGAQDARLFKDAKLIAITADGLSSEGSIATLEVTVLAGRISISPGLVRAEGRRGNAKSFPADIENSLVLESGGHTLRLESTGSGVQVSEL